MSRMQVFLLTLALPLVGTVSAQQKPQHGLKVEDIVAKIKKGDEKLVFWNYNAKQPFAYVLRTDGHHLGMWFQGEETPFKSNYKRMSNVPSGLPRWAEQFFKGNWEAKQPFLFLAIYEDHTRKSEPSDYEPVFYGYRRGEMMFPRGCVEKPCLSIDDAKPMLQKELDTLTAWTFNPDGVARLKVQ